MDPSEERKIESVDISLSITLSDHKGAVNSVIVLSDFGLFVSCGNDKTLRVWDYEGRCKKKLVTAAAVYDGVRNGWEEFTSFHTNGHAIRWKIPDFELVQDIDFVTILQSEDPPNPFEDSEHSHSKMVSHIFEFFNLYSSDAKFRALSSQALKFYHYDIFDESKIHFAIPNSMDDHLSEGTFLCMLKNIDFNYKKRLPSMSEHFDTDYDMTRYCVSSHHEYVHQVNDRTGRRENWDITLGRNSVYLTELDDEPMSLVGENPDPNPEIGKMYGAVRLLRYWNKETGFFGESMDEQYYHRGRITSLDSYTLQDERCMEGVREVVMSGGSDGRIIFWDILEDIGMDNNYTHYELVDYFYDNLKKKNRLIDCGVGVSSLLSWDSTKLIAGLDNGSIELFSIGSKKSIRRKQDVHASKVVRLQWLSKNQFVSCSLDGEIKIWSVIEDGILALEDERSRIEFLKDEGNKGLFKHCGVKVNVKGRSVFGLFKCLL